MYFTPDPDVLALLGRADDIVLLTHIYPDGDALGSELALAEGLRALGKRVRVWNGQPPPERLRFLDAAGDVELITPSRIPSLPECGLLVTVDTSDPARLGDLEAYFHRSRASKAACDHHIMPRDHRFDAAWAEPRAGATGILIMDLLDALGVTPSPAAAAALFAAVAADTGWFAFSNTGVNELDAAGRLVTLGACPSSLFRRLYGNASLMRTLLLGEALASIRTECDGRFLWSCITQRQMTDKGIEYAELDGFIDHLTHVKNAGIVALIVELDSGAWKVSLRGPAQYEVNAIARRFGGGGHAKAAGYRVAGGHLEAILDDLRAQVAQLLAP